MKTRRELLSVAAALCVWAFGPQSSRAQDVLFVGDAGDNSVKVFDATDGSFLYAMDGPAVSGLLGPRGIILQGDDLLVVNQNVGLPTPGAVLRFDAATGTFLGPVVAASDEDAPFAPFGMVLDAQNNLLVGNLLRKASSSPGRVSGYDSDTGVFLGDLTVKGSEHHPRGVVFGADGTFYTAARDLKKTGLGGTIFRFNKVNSKAEVFIDDKGGFGQLNRPDGVVFGPDGRLYVTSFRAAPGDTDSIRIYNADGQFADKIDLFDPLSEPRAFSQAILFGPDGKLFVSILDRNGLNNNLGELRRYDVATKSYDIFAANVSDGGVLLQPYYMTFGLTNPSTLNYESE